MIRLTGHGTRCRSRAMAMMAMTCAAGAMTVSQSALADGEKERTYAGMIALTQQMEELRGQMRSNPAAAALYEQLQAAYKSASDSLGGDDPGRMYSKRPKPSATQTPPSPPVVIGQRPDGALAGTTTTPPGCTSTSVLPANFANGPLVDAGTLTSTITVGGVTPMPGAIWYVDSGIVVDHTFSADLDILLTSPSGTTIIVSSDNGGSNDDVFSTIFTDRANPGGALPYSTNDGMVTDHAYVDLTIATPLTPEEPFNAFTGEDPNGVWTLTVTDDTAGDTGTLIGWDILIITSPPPSNETTRTFANTTVAPFPVPSPGVTSDVNVGGMAGYVSDVDVRVNLAHTWNLDVDMTLTSPSGTVVTLTTDNGSTVDDVFAGTVFDDDASPGAGGERVTTDATYVNLVAKNVLTPEEGLSTFRGEPANGTWTLTISDDFPAADGGALNAWAVTITTASCGPSCPGDINGDGLTNVTDLLAVISLWGSCP